MAIVHDFELDVRGEACPYPLIRTKQQVDRLQKGDVLKVLASDPEEHRRMGKEIRE